METEKLFIGKTKKQWIITLSFILLLSLISMLQILFKFTDSTITIIGYQIDVNLLIQSSIIGLILPLALILASSIVVILKLKQFPLTNSSFSPALKNICESSVCSDFSR